MKHSGFDPTRFDDALRQRHAAAVAHVSPRTQAQLHNRLAASATAPRHFVRHRVAWAAATACAALFALVIGLQLRPQPTPASSPTSVTDDGQVDANTAYAALDENPDLYLWLASSDAVALASE
jgi:ferric-dicitrate binding protein FerR (iron transport regulator)